MRKPPLLVDVVVHVHLLDQLVALDWIVPRSVRNVLRHIVAV
jgi:hypothetical protein